MDLYKNIPYFESEIQIEKNDENIEPLITLSYVLPKKNLLVLMSISESVVEYRK